MKRSGKKQNGDVGGEELTVQNVIGCTVSTSEALGIVDSSFVYPVGSLIKFTSDDSREYLFCRKGKQISCLDVSSDSTKIVTGETGHDPYVCVWDIWSRKAVAKVCGHKFGVQCVRFSPDGDMILSLSEVHEQQVQIWNWQTKLVLATVRTNCVVESIWFGKGFFVGVGKGVIKKWTIKDKLRGNGKKLEAHDFRATNFQKAVFCCVVGRVKSDPIFVLTTLGILCVFSLSTLSLRKWVDLRMSVGASLDLMGDKLLIGGGKGKVRIFDSKTLDHLCTFPEPPLSTNEPGKKFPDLIVAKFNPNKGQVLCIYDTRSMVTWDVSQDEEIAVRLGRVEHYHQRCIWDMCTIDNEDCDADLVTCSEDCTVRFWGTDKFEQLSIIRTEDSASRCASLSGNKSVVRCLSSRGSALVLANRRGQVRQYSLPNLMENSESPPEFEHNYHDKEVLSVDIHMGEERNLVVSSGRDRNIVLYNTEELAQSKKIVKLAHSGTVNSVRFSSTGSRLLSCGADKCVVFHSIKDGEHPKTCGKGFVPRGTLHHACVHPGNKFAITAGSDKLLRVWNVQTGAQARQYSTGSAEPLKVCLDPSGMYIGVSCSDKSVRLLDWFSGQCLFKSFIHADTVTALTFSTDCTRLISCDGNGCIVVWKLPETIVTVMKERLEELQVSQRMKELERLAKAELEKKKESEQPPGPPKEAFKEENVAAAPEHIEFTSPRREACESIEEKASKPVNNQKSSKSKWADRINSPYKLFTEQSEASTTIRPQEEMKVMTLSSDTMIETDQNEECTIEDLENEVRNLELTSTSELDIAANGDVPVSFVQSLAKDSPDPFGDLQDGDLDGNTEEEVEAKPFNDSEVEAGISIETEIEETVKVSEKVDKEDCQQSEIEKEHCETEFKIEKSQELESEKETSEQEEENQEEHQIENVEETITTDEITASDTIDTIEENPEIPKQADTMCDEESYDEMLIDLMQLLDENRDGSLDVEELAKAFPNMKQQSIEVVHKCFDRDGSDGLDIDELKQFFADKESLREALQTLREALTPYEKALRKLLKMLDTNGDGFVSQSELSKLYPNMGENSLQSLCKIFDEDGNGLLDREELMKFVPDVTSAENIISDLCPPEKVPEKASPDPDELLSQVRSEDIDDEFCEPEINEAPAENYLDVISSPDITRASVSLEPSPTTVTQATVLESSQAMGSTITSMRTSLDLLRHQWSEEKPESRSELRRELIDIRNEITKILCEPSPSDTVQSAATDFSTNSEVMVSTIESYSDLLVQMVQRKLSSLTPTSLEG